MKNEITENGKNVIELQIKALKKLKNSIDTSFEHAVKKISKCKSKVVICGVGKSGIIASKISATLSSVGTPSFSISANDCSHGDLGRITHKDVLILIFNFKEELENYKINMKINRISKRLAIYNKFTDEYNQLENDDIRKVFYKRIVNRIISRKNILLSKMEKMKNFNRNLILEFN